MVKPDEYKDYAWLDLCKRVYIALREADPDKALRMLESAGFSTEDTVPW